jgi:serine protease Do
MNEIDLPLRPMQRLRPVGWLAVTVLILASQHLSGTESGSADLSCNEPIKVALAPRFEGSLSGFAVAVQKVAPTVVRVVTAQRSSTPAEFTSGAPEALQSHVSEQMPRIQSGLVTRGLGAGVVVTKDGYIVTTSHLVAGATELKVTLQDGRDFNARMIGLDAKTDIAVIKIDARDLPTVSLAESRKVQVGDLVLAFGHPFGVGQTVTHGIVSATDRGGLGIEDYESFIQTDAPINPGNSGGALVDVTGELIGINTAILSKSGGNQGIGFAVPADLVRRVMTDLMTYGFVVRGYVGVEAQDLTPQLAKEFKLTGITGVLIGGVVPRGPAAQAGMQVGDVITRFDGQEVRGCRQLKLSVAEAKPGQTVPVEVRRDGAVRALSVTIRHASSSDLLTKSERSVFEPEAGVFEGVFLGELNAELRQRLSIPREVQGAVVFDLHAYSPAAQGGLRPGDVIQSINRQDVANAGEAVRLLQNTKARRALLRVWNQAGSHFLLVAN